MISAGRRWPHTAHVGVAVLIYCAALTSLGTFVLYFGELHHDATETWAWGKEFQLGYAKHPPFSAWIAGLWFAVMPRADWAFYLLASLNAALGLAGVWRFASLFVSRPGRWHSVLFLVLTPSFTLWALKFNANAPLLSTWPWTTYFFLQSLTTRRVSASVLAGAIGAMAMLTKYSSIVLFATLLIVAVTHPARSRYFASAAPYLTLLTGVVLVSPHIWWLFASDFPTVGYALSKMHASIAEAQSQTFHSALGSLAALGIAAAAGVSAFGTRGWPLLKRAAAALTDRSKAWISALVLGPFLLTIAGCYVANLRVSSGFLIPVFFALPAVSVVLSHARVTPVVVRRLAISVAVVWVPVLLTSPLFAYYAFPAGDPATIEPRRQVAVAATAVWRTVTGHPLRYVAGTAALATAATFHSPDAPSYMVLDDPAASPWVRADDLHRSGLLIICRGADAGCLGRAQGLAGENGLRYAQTFTGSYLGRTSRPQRFVFFLLPPAGASVVWD